MKNKEYIDQVWLNELDAPTDLYPIITKKRFEWILDLAMQKQREACAEVYWQRVELEPPHTLKQSILNAEVKA